MPGERPATIAGDHDTGLRDTILAIWAGASPEGEDRRAIIFGDLGLAEPRRVAKRLIYKKPPDAGTHGAIAGFRHDIEAIWLTGKWPAAIGGRSSVLETNARMVGGAVGPAGRYGHPHAKPVDVCETLAALALRDPAPVIADPCAGAGSILVAARNLGLPAIGVELEEPYCERIAQRLSQGVLIDGPLEAPPMHYRLAGEDGGTLVPDDGWLE
jgi:site-specific DNA-methyltransferase (adenine-specific)